MQSVQGINFQHTGYHVHLSSGFPVTGGASLYISKQQNQTTDCGAARSAVPHFCPCMPQVLSGETRFLRIRAYPEKIGAEAPEQPQNSRQSQKLGIFVRALAQTRPAGTEPPLAS